MGKKGREVDVHTLHIHTDGQTDETKGDGVVDDERGQRD